MKRTVAFILSIVLVLGISAAMLAVAADDYVPSVEHPTVTTDTEAVVTETETEPAPAKSGCGSTLSCGILVAVIPAALMFVARKKED
jgi:hypothetical protein